MEDARLAGLVVLDGVYKKLTVNEELSLKGQFEQQTPYNFSAYLEGEELKTFVVLADGVPYDVCREIIDRHPQWAEEIIANKLQNQCFAEMDNIVGFFYNDELTNNMDSCKTDADCGECGECKNHICSFGVKDGDGNCHFCDSSSKQITHVSKEECIKCRNRIWSSRYEGRCLSRLDGIDGSNFWADVPTDECKKFPKHYSASNGGRCFYCAGTFDPTTGVCDTTSCRNNKLYKSVIYGVDEATCAQCGGTYQLLNTPGAGNVGEFSGISQ